MEYQLNAYSECYCTSSECAQIHHHYGYEISLFHKFALYFNLRNREYTFCTLFLLEWWFIFNALRLQVFSPISFIVVGDSVRNRVEFSTRSPTECSAHYTKTIRARKLNLVSILALKTQTHWVNEFIPYWALFQHTSATA